MPLRHVVLGALTVGVFAMGVYLFIQVRATPALADGQAMSHDERSTPTKPAPNPPVTPPSIGSGKAVHAAEPPPQIAATGDDDDGSAVANPKADSLMDQANKAYDRQDFEEAKVIAAKVLAKQPTNVRMMRIMVSASCIDGDTPQAQKYYELLPKADRDQMKARCDKYGFSFKEPPQ